MNEESLLQYYSKILTDINNLKVSLDFNQVEYIKLYGRPEDQSEYHDMMYEVYSTHENVPYQSKVLFYKILYFLEIQGLTNYYSLFWNNFYNWMNVESEIFKKTYIDEIDEYINTLTFELNEILSPFYYLEEKIINQVSDENEKQLSIHLMYLERILNNVSFYMNKRSFKPLKEKDLFDFIEPWLRVYFPEVEKIPQIQFIKKLKSYIPDFFIPECRAIIELKYINNEKDLISCIESIDTDIIGYDGNGKYKIFYAVFYLNKPYITNDEFKILWNERKYPINWKGILNIEFNIEKK